MTDIQVMHVYSEKVGLEKIERDQFATKLDHDGVIFVHTVERGHGTYWPSVSLGGKTMKPYHFNRVTQQEYYDVFEAPILRGDVVVGWNRVWAIENSKGGAFKIESWSVNGPHIAPPVSDYLYIL